MGYHTDCCRRIRCFLAAGAVKMTANALGAVSSVTGSVLSGAGNAVGSGISALSEEAEEVFGKIDFNATLKKKTYHRIYVLHLSRAM